MSNQSEEYLISRIILYDDHKAFEQLMKIHQNGLRNMLLKLVDFKQAELDDLTQESFIKIYKNLKSFKGESAFSTWVYQIAYRSFLDSTKKNKRYQTLKDQSASQAYQTTNTPAQQDNRMDAERMISCLKPEEKAAIQLSYIQGFSHKDIAQILDCPLGTVKSLIKRGKERIQKKFNIS